MRRFLWLFFLPVLASSCAPAERPSLVLATTTSVQGSGLLAALMAGYQRDAGVELRPIVVGSGQALQLAARGTVDVTITHDPEAEAKFSASRHPAFYRQFMWNDFVVAGPAGDPAGVVGSKSAAEAFRRLADKGALFCSRNDRSGTNTKELAVWKLAGVDPHSLPGYRPLGQSMSMLLRSTSELGAYTLSDRPTFDQVGRAKGLQIVFEGDPFLRNTYAVTMVRRTTASQAFVDWLLKGRGGELIRQFTVHGRREYFPLAP